MKTRFIPALFALIGFLTASQSALAAPKKADEHTASLVAALQAVSPDPLGGRLGLAATAARTEIAPARSESTAPKLTVQSARATIDQRAYVIWKSSQKS
jgi:hypothetical protein